MTSIDLTTSSTIDVTSGIYKINVNTNIPMCITNDTDSVVLVGLNETFTTANGIGQYIKLASGSAVNGYKPCASEYALVFYLNVSGTGTITIAGKEW